MSYSRECSHIINIYQEEQGQQKGNLYLSGLGVLKDPLFKEKYKIGCVLTVIDTKCYWGCKVAQKVAKLGIEHHKWFQIDDIPQQTILPFFEEGHLFIGEKLKEHNVLVHCMVGKSRSASIVTAFLMKEFGMSYEQALDYVRKKRDIIKPNPSFIKDLHAFQTMLKEGGEKEKM